MSDFGKLYTGMLNEIISEMKKENPPISLEEALNLAETYRKGFYEIAEKRGDKEEVEEDIKMVESAYEELKKLIKV